MHSSTVVFCLHAHSGRAPHLLAEVLLIRRGDDESRTHCPKVLKCTLIPWRTRTSLLANIDSGHCPNRMGCALSTFLAHDLQEAAIRFPGTPVEANVPPVGVEAFTFRGFQLVEEPLCLLVCWFCAVHFQTMVFERKSKLTATEFANLLSQNG